MVLQNKLVSGLDKSVNYVFDNMLESRFVQRGDNYFIVYLSSHVGCNKACRFCHLTQSKQTDMKSATMHDYLYQATYPLEHYLTGATKHVEKIHYNFMSRGEFFSNDVVLSKNADILFTKLKNLQQSLGLECQSLMNISTILPKELENLEISNLVPAIDENRIYYSLYHSDDNKRKKWLPKALGVEASMLKLKRYKDDGGAVFFHHSFISGFNDDIDDVKRMCDLIDRYGLNKDSKFNLVRYNPYSMRQGVESSDEVISTNLSIINDCFTGNTKIVPRVGFDVKASCGMFV